MKEVIEMFNLMEIVENFTKRQNKTIFCIVEKLKIEEHLLNVFHKIF